MKISYLLLAILAAASLSALAAEKTVTMHAIGADGIGSAIGTVQLADGAQGLVLTTDLRGLPPGAHGFHVHEQPDCATLTKDGKPVAGLGAGGHYDPTHSGHHAGPDGAGHAGDLPLLTVAADGSASGSLTASRLRLADVENRALIIHAGGDNYSDDPKPLGGGGARIACGVIE